MTIRSSSGFSHFRPGAFYTTDATYIIETGRKKNQKAQTWVRPKRKKGQVLGTFLAFCASVSVTSVYSNKNSHTATGNADSSSRARRPYLWVHRSLFIAQQPPFSDRRLSLTVANFLLLTALGPCLSSSSSGLVRNLARKPFVWVSRTKHSKESSDWRTPTPTETNRPPRATSVLISVYFVFKSIFIIVLFWEFFQRSVCS